MKHTAFKQPYLAWLLLLPQLVMTLLFFVLPALQALVSAFYEGDPFGHCQHFVGLAHFIELWGNHSYWETVMVTLVFSGLVTLLTLVLGVVVAFFVNSLPRFQRWFRTLYLLPYAVAPAVAAMLWHFLFTPGIGWGAYLLERCGIAWQPMLNANQALLLVVVVSCWQQFSYNFLFVLAAMKTVPKTLIDAASLDGAGAWQVFIRIVFPLLTPTLFFLLVMNLIYAFFETFGVIQVLTQGGPVRATTNMVYKVYSDGFLGLDVGGASAQSVVLMMAMVVLTLLQFQFLERRVHYAGAGVV